MNSYDILVTGLFFLMCGCKTVSPPQTVKEVELDRFMGDWYVVASIPTRFEQGAHNALENYQMDDKGHINITFSFNKGAFDGPLKTYSSAAFVHNEDTFSEWRIQFIWALKFPYLIIYLEDNYLATAVATKDKKYLWLMSRSPQMPEDLYNEIIEVVEKQGFDTTKIIPVPQKAQTLDFRP